MPNERDDDSAIKQAVSLFLWDSLAKVSIPLNKRTR